MCHLLRLIFLCALVNTINLQQKYLNDCCPMHELEAVASFHEKESIIDKTYKKKCLDYTHNMTFQS